MEMMMTEKGLLPTSELTFVNLWFADDINPDVMWHWIQWKHGDEVVRTDKHGCILKGLNVGAETAKVA